MGYHPFFLVFGQVLDQQVVGALQLRIAVNLLHYTFPDALLAVDFAHFVQDNRAFETVAGHGLDVGPIFGVFFDVGINLRVHFRVDPKSGLIRGGGIAAGARWRWGFRFVHNDSFLFGLFFSAFAVSAGERAASRRRHSGKASSGFWFLQ